MNLQPIKARFNSTCKETGNPLLKGTTIYHDAANKVAYHADSETVKKFLADQNTQAERGNDFIEDPGEIDAGNWEANNFI